MRNFFEPLTQAIEKQEMDSFNCKPKTVIEVNSDRYNQDKAYQQSIDETFKKVIV